LSTAWSTNIDCQNQAAPAWGVVGIRAKGIDGAVREQNEAIVSRLEMVPIADDLLEEAI
jgi:hypothetical protein